MAGLATCPVTHLTEVGVTRELIRSLMDYDAVPQVLIRVGRGTGHRESAAAHTAAPTLRSSTTQGLWGIAMRDSTATPLPIVVGIDGSQAAIQAAEWAVDEAVSREVPLRLVEVIPRQAEPAPLASVGNVRMEVEYAETSLRIAAAAVAADGKPVKVETAILRGNPAAAASSRIPRRRNGVRRFDGDRALCASITGLHGRRARRSRALPGRHHPHPAAPGEARH